MTMMSASGDQPMRYACPNAQNPHGSSCDTPGIEARQLNELVMEDLVAGILTDDLMQDVIAQIRRDSAQQTLEEERHLDAVRKQSDALERDRARLLADVEQGDTAFGSVSERLASLGEGWQVVQNEARQAEHLLEGCRYVATDEDRMESYARNPDTYLRGLNAAAAIASITASSSVEPVSISTLVSGSRSSMSRHASTPSFPGIITSMMITSGRDSSAVLTASNPSAASATTSNRCKNG